MINGDIQRLNILTDDDETTPWVPSINSIYTVPANFRDIILNEMIPDETIQDAPVSYLGNTAREGVWIQLNNYKTNIGGILKLDISGNLNCLIELLGSNQNDFDTSGNSVTRITQQVLYDRHSEILPISMRTQDLITDETYTYYRIVFLSIGELGVVPEGERDTHLNISKLTIYPAIFYGVAYDGENYTTRITEISIDSNDSTETDMITLIGTGEYNAPTLLKIYSADIHTNNNPVGELTFYNSGYQLTSGGTAFISDGANGPFGISGVMYDISGNDYDISGNEVKVYLKYRHYDGKESPQISFRFGDTDMDDEYSYFSQIHYIRINEYYVIYNESSTGHSTLARTFDNLTIKTLDYNYLLFTITFIATPPFLKDNGYVILESGGTGFGLSIYIIHNKLFANFGNGQKEYDDEGGSQVALGTFTLDSVNNTVLDGIPVFDNNDNCIIHNKIEVELFNDGSGSLFTLQINDSTQYQYQQSGPASIDLINGTNSGAVGKINGVSVALLSTHYVNIQYEEFVEFDENFNWNLLVQRTNLENTIGYDQ